MKQEHVYDAIRGTHEYTGEILKGLDRRRHGQAILLIASSVDHQGVSELFTTVGGNNCYLIGTLAVALKDKPELKHAFLTAIALSELGDPAIRDIIHKETNN